MGGPVVPGGHRGRRGFGGIAKARKRESAKARRRKLRKGPLERRRPRVRPSLTNCSWAPCTPGRTEPTGKPTKQTLRTHHGFGACPHTEPFAGFAVLSRFRDSASAHLTRTLADTPESLPAPPHSCFRAFACCCSARPGTETPLDARGRHRFPPFSGFLVLTSTIARAARFLRSFASSHCCGMLAMLLTA